MYLLALGLLLPLAVPGASPALADNRRPFYNIAHMVNSIPEIEHYLSLGANAVEVDVSFAPNGEVVRVYHGVPCDCYRRCSLRTAFGAYLEHLRMLRSSDDRRLVLLMLDLKLEEFEASPETLRFAGEDLFNQLVDHLWRGSSAEDRLNVLVSIQRVEQRGFFEGFLNEMRKEGHTAYAANIAYDVGMNSEPGDIASMYESLGIKEGIWQGDGITNCFVELRADGRLRKVLGSRDSPSGYVSKVYYWTVDTSLTMEQILEKGVDALITNRPDRAVSLVNRYSSLYRLADTRDSPWKKVILDGTATVPQRDRGLGIYDTMEKLSELASQAGGYFTSFLRPTGTG